MFECKGCAARDIQIQDLRTCHVCAQKDVMIAFLREQLVQKDSQIAEYKREYKRAIDRVLEKEGVQPVREEVGGERSIDMASMLNIFEEVPIGETK